MSKLKLNNYFDLDAPGSTTTQRYQLLTLRPKIKPLLYYKGLPPHDRDHARQKRVRNYKVMVEQESYPEQLSFTPQKHSYCSRYSFQKQVRRLHIAFPNLETFMKIIMYLVYRYTGLKAIHISLKGLIRPESLGKLSRCLSKLSRINDLTLALYQKQLKVRDQSITKLDKSLSRLKRLKNFNLSFTENKIHAHQVGMVLVGSIFEIKDQGMVIFPRLFTAMTHLVKVELTIQEQNNITDNELENFGRRLRKLQNLTSVSLNFFDCLSLSFRGFNNMLNHIALLPQLNSLGIGFPIFESIGRKMEVPSYHPIWRMETLLHASLEVKLYAMFQTDLMDGLAESVAQIVSLEKLILVCNRAQFVINKHINDLMYSLSTLPKLYHLDLDFVICQSLHASLANNIMSYITTMPKLQTVSLNFQTCFKRIVGALLPQEIEIEDSLRTVCPLTKLTIGYADCKEMTLDQVIESLNLIQMCPDLKELTVSLNWCEVVKEEHIQELIRTIACLKSLESLTIQLQGRYKGTRETFFAFKKLHLPHLRSLDINVSNWTGVTDNDMQAIGKTIATFRNLENMKLSFQGCKGVTDFHIEKMSSYFVNLARLSSLTLQWSATKFKETSNNVAARLEDCLKRLCYIQFNSGNSKIWMWMRD